MSMSKVLLDVDNIQYSCLDFSYHHLQSCSKPIVVKFADTQREKKPTAGGSIATLGGGGGVIAGAAGSTESMDASALMMQVGRVKRDKIPI